MNVQGRIALVTGAASGIGRAVAGEFARRGVGGLVLVDMASPVEEVARMIGDEHPAVRVMACVGNASDEGFRRRVYDEAASRLGGVVRVVVPAAGITRDRLAVKVDKATGRADVYPLEDFRLVLEVNLVAPVYWAMEMVGRIAEERARKGLKRWDPAEGFEGVVVFIGSISSRGNAGQVSYAATKAGLTGAAATLTKEAMFHGVRCAVVHPGFTDTPMVRAMGEEIVRDKVLPHVQFRRLIRPEEIADAIGFMVGNDVVSGELWADAGWHPPV